MKEKILNSKYFIVIITIFTVFYLLYASYPAGAITMSNEDYIIHMSDFNMSSGDIKNNKYKMVTTTGQTTPGLYTGKNYKVKAGFEYLYPFVSFSFSISQTLIDFGELSATNPVTRTMDLSIANPPPGGYHVLAYEDHSLLAPSNAIIPDTSCDNGLCNESTPAEWVNTLTYGFGYRCDNKAESDCSDNFTDTNTFMPFADNSKQKAPQVVMQGNKIFEKAQSQITYKVNVSGTQVPGMYTNTITYIATPGY